MADPFCTDFDASSALQHSPDGEDGEGEETLEDFEKSFVAEQPDVAELICLLDQPPVTKSKKQEKRDRVARLEAMTLSGRKLFEKRVKQQKRSADLDALHSQWSTGPMSLLLRAFRENLRVEVHIRALNRIDRIARGFLSAFDQHFNVLLRDVDEVALPGRKEERAFGRRKEQEKYLPVGMHWQPGGIWPRPLGACRTVLRRFIACSMIKGDTIVLIRLLS